MADSRSVMKEFRLLDQKRSAEGLTADEELRLAELRDLVGVGSATPKPGFDVSAAAARLRESLLPAGLRNRPPPQPEPAPEPISEIEPAAEPAAFGEPEAPAYAEGGGAVAYDANGVAYDPNAAAYDPNAAAYDPNAAAYDPNAAAYDPNAAAYDPNAAAYDPNAVAYDPNAAAYDPNAVVYDPNAAAYDPNAPAYDPNAAAYDPNAPAYDPNAAAYDPNAAAYDPNAAAYDPNAPAYDPNAAAYDPNAAAWSASAVPLEEDASALPPEMVALEPPAPEPSAEEDLAFAAEPAEGLSGTFDQGQPASAASDEGLVPSQAEGVWASLTVDVDGAPAEATPAAALDGAEVEEVPLEVGEPLLEEMDVPAPLPGEGENPAWAPQPGGDYDAAAWDGGASPPGAFLPGPLPDLPASIDADPSALAEPRPVPSGDLAPLVPDGWAPEASPPEPATAEFGAYDEATPARMEEDLEALLPFDPAAEAAVGADALRAFDGPPIDLASAGFGRAEEPADVLERDGFQAAPAVVGEEASGWQAEPALVDRGFELESGGSFDAAADAVAPEWAAPAEPMPWEVQAEEAAAPAELEPAPVAEEPAPAAFIEPAPVVEEPAPVAHAEPEPAEPPVEVDLPFLDAVTEPALDELPTLEAEEIVEEVPAEALTPIEHAPEPLETAALAPPPAAPEEPPPYLVPTPAQPEPAPLMAAAPEVHAVAIQAAQRVPTEAFAAAQPTPLAAGAVEDVLPLEEAVPVEEAIPVEEAPAPAAAQDRVVHGLHRAVVHTIEQQVRRGFLQDADLGGPALALAPAPGAEPELLPADRVKAIFFMLGPGEQPPPPLGSKVRVTFRDGRQVAGYSPAYREDSSGFFMIPADARTSTARIWVYRSAVRQVVVS